MTATARPRLLPLAALAALALLSACGKGDAGKDDASAPDRAAEKAERGGTAVMAELTDISKPMPLLFENALDGDLVDVMYMGLTRGAWRDGKLVHLTSSDSPMALAWRHELVGPDSASMRFRMRSAVRWSDGKPVTAHDVVWTYRMVADPKLASARQDYAAHIDSVVAENDSTVVFHFKRRYPEMLVHSGLPIAPRHVFEAGDPAQMRNHPAILNPAGRLVVSGAFRIAQWTKGQQVVLEPNPHFVPRPYLDRIVIRSIPEETTRLTELQTGRVDFMRPVSYDKVPMLRAQAPALRFMREEKRNYDYIGYNPRTVPAFADPEIRMALGLALDTKGVVDALQMTEFAVPAGGPYAPIFESLYDPVSMAPLPHDPARARQILAAKGWKDTDGDGIVEKDGRPFRFTLLTNAGNQRRSDVSQIVQQQWKQVGIDARLETTETVAFFERLREKRFEAALAGWSVGLSPDLTPLWGKDSPFNFTSYDNPAVLALMDSALAQPTEEAAAPYWRRAAAGIVKDRPYTWLYYRDEVDGVNERLRGMRVDTYGAYQNAWEWWIPRAKQQGAGARVGPAAPPADTTKG